jgi:hypothetical protein
LINIPDLQLSSSWHKIGRSIWQGWIMIFKTQQDFTQMELIPFKFACNHSDHHFLFLNCLMIGCLSLLVCWRRRSQPIDKIYSDLYLNIQMDNLSEINFILIIHCIYIDSTFLHTPNSIQWNMFKPNPE